MEVASVSTWGLVVGLNVAFIMAIVLGYSLCKMAQGEQR